MLNTLFAAISRGWLSKLSALLWTLFSLSTVRGNNYKYQSYAYNSLFHNIWMKRKNLKMTISANIKKVRSWNKILQKLCCRIEVSFIDKFFLIGKASLYKITGIFKFKSYCAIIVFHSPRKSLQRYSGSKAFIQSFPVVLVRTIIIKSQCCLGWITQKIELSNFEYIVKCIFGKK